MKDEIALKGILKEVENQMRENNIEGFKLAVRNLIKDAMKAVEALPREWKRRHNSRELKEKIDLLYHDLDYLRRFCEGKV